MTAQGYEGRDWTLKPVLIFIFGFAASLLVTMAVTWGAYSLFIDIAESGHTPAHPLSEGRQEPPKPRLQVIPTAQLDRHRKHAAEQLTTYGWIDREAGKVRLPIERAMDLVLEDGLEVREEQP